MILLIDDNAALGETLARVIQRTTGEQVQVITQPTDALIAVRTHAPSLRLIVLDIHMPFLDGRTLCARLRQVVPHVPILPFTAVDEALPLLQELGCVAPVLKRSDVATVLARIHAALQEVPPPMSSAPWMEALALQAQAIDDAAQGYSETLLVSRQTMEQIHTHLQKDHRVHPGRHVTAALAILQKCLLRPPATRA